MNGKLISLLLTVLLLAGCGWNLFSSGPTLDDKIGQMLMVGFRGTVVGRDHFILRDIRRYNLGGVVLFDQDTLQKQDKRNISSPAQLKVLTISLQQAASTPLLIAVDQEGGKVARLKEGAGFPTTRSHRNLGWLDDLTTTDKEADKIAATLADLGINLNLAPVVDLCSNPNNPVIAKRERCFSDDPNKVTAHALSYIKAHHRHGVLTTLKHFPGHGSSQADSHLGFTDVSNTWSARELLPFTRIIAAGQADAIMTAHVFNARLDSRYPATLSKTIVDDLLRGRFCFEGVVISDDLQMRAIADHYGLETAIFQAIDAGVDILVFGNNLTYDEEIVPRTIELIRKMVDSGKISKDRIDQSYGRITEMKSRLENSFNEATR
ncbi:MAG: glycoside hydrolase family 3 protein [Deltaproteobacteria bacterium]|nr:glycoside hydrolase family 3 protein [Deltaproteobacteria bacterium]